MIKYYITITIGLSLTIGALVWGSYNYPPLGNITPQHLQLKAPIERIGPHKIITQYDYDEKGKPIEETKREYVSYKYRSENPSQLFENEILEKRTVNTITQSLGNNKYVATGFLGQRFYKETQEGVWYDVLRATTTIEAFETQMEISLISRLFGKALADDTGFQSPGTGGNDATIGTIDWGNTVGVYDTNAEPVFGGADYPTGGAVSTSHYLTATNYGFSVSGDIDGIELGFKDNSPNTTNIDHESVKLIIGGSITGDEKSEGATVQVWNAQDRSFGGAEDLWGTTPTDTQINNSNFGAGISFRLTSTPGFKSAYVNNVTIKVYYTEAAAEEAPPTQIFHVR